MANIPICWVRFSPYMHPLIISLFRLKEQYDGIAIVDICAVRGVEELLHKPYIINSRAEVTSEWTFSTQLMRILRASRRISPSIVRQEFNTTEKVIDECLPVLVPEVVMAAGLNRPWNPTMQIASPVARHIHEAVRKLYWQHLARFDKRYKQAALLNGSDYTAEEMIDTWCQRYNIDSTYAESIGRMYRRTKSRLFNKP